MSVFVGALAVFVTLSLAFGLIVRLLWPALRRYAFARWQRASLLWFATIVGPFALAAIGVLALLVPAPFAACHCLQHVMHHPHLCLTHPTWADSLVVPAGIVVALWLVCVFPRLTRLFRATREAACRKRSIREAPATHIHETPIHILSCGRPTAFTVGVLRPLIVVDRTLWEALATKEREAVVQHERGHLVRKDGLSLLVLNWCVASQPWLPKDMLARWRLASELACDEHAASQMSDRLAVAEALVRVESLRGNVPPVGDAEFAMGISGDRMLELRVTALLDRAANPVLGNDVFGLALVTLAAAVLAAVWPGDTFHHAIETAIGFIHP